MTKVAVVIGAGPGIGVSVAKKYAKEGYSVGLLGRNKERLENDQKEIEKVFNFI